MIEKSQVVLKAKRRIAGDIVTQMLTLATNGLGLVAALAWNGVIQEAVNNYIKPYIGKGSGIISLLIYAIIVTALAVLITYQLAKLKDKFTPEVPSELEESRRSGQKR
ncbi:MAG: DUF5654 family protein [Candidatus Gottesmanbacteria bacterium]